MGKPHSREPTATFDGACLICLIACHALDGRGIRFDLLDDVLKVESEATTVLVIGGDHATGEQIADRPVASRWVVPS